MYWAFVVSHSIWFRNPRRLPALTHSVFLYASMPASQSSHGAQETHFSVSLPSAHMCATTRGTWVSVGLLRQHDCLMTLQLSLLGTSASVFWLWAHKPSPKCTRSALASKDFTCCCAACILHWGLDWGLLVLCTSQSLSRMIGQLLEGGQREGLCACI